MDLGVTGLVWSFCLFPLFRLLRNRVSAQQARERKKAYLSDLETKVKDLENKNSELEERLSTLLNENQMLRHVCLFLSRFFIFPTRDHSSIVVAS